MKKRKGSADREAIGWFVAFFRSRLLSLRHRNR